MKHKGEPSKFEEIIWRNVCYSFAESILVHGFQMAPGLKRTDSRFYTDATHAEWAKDFYDNMVNARKDPKIMYDDRKFICKKISSTNTMNLFYKAANNLYFFLQGVHQVSEDNILAPHQADFRDNKDRNYEHIRTMVNDRETKEKSQHEPNVLAQAHTAELTLEKHAEVMRRALLSPVSLSSATLAAKAALKWGAGLRDVQVRALKLADIGCSLSAMSTILSASGISDNASAAKHKLLVTYTGNFRSQNGSNHQEFSYLVRTRDSIMCPFAALGLVFYQRYRISGHPTSFSIETSDADSREDSVNIASNPSSSSAASSSSTTSESSDTSQSRKYYQQYLFCHDIDAAKPAQQFKSLMRKWLNESGVQKSIHHAQRKGAAVYVQLTNQETISRIAAFLRHKAEINKTTFAHYMSQLDPATIFCLAGFAKGQMYIIEYAAARKDLESTSEFQELVQQLMAPDVMDYIDMEGQPLSSRKQESKKRPGLFHLLELQLECAKCLVEMAADQWNKQKRDLAIFRLRPFRGEAFQNFAAKLVIRQREAEHQRDQYMRSELDKRKITSAMQLLINEVRSVREQLTRLENQISQRQHEPGSSNYVGAQPINFYGSSISDVEAVSWPKDGEPWPEDVRWLGRLPDHRKYVMDPNIKSLEQIYNQWKKGFDGFPSLESMESRYGTRWRKFANNHGGTLKSFSTAIARVKRVGKYIDTFGGTYESNLQTAQESLEDWADAHGNRKARGSSHIRAWVMAMRPADPEIRERMKHIRKKRRKT